VFKKYLSQNFLVDRNIIKKIINNISIKNNDTVIEIGPGKGALSKHIFKLPKKLFLIEIDKCFVVSLENNIQSEKIKIYGDNILSFDFKNILTEIDKIRIIGNIPYKISTRLILHLSNIKDFIKDIHFVVQNELSDKFIKNNKNSYAKILVQYHFNIEKKFKIQASSFIPKPKIDSAFIKITPRIYHKKILNYSHFKILVKKLISQKNKCVFKSIKEIYFYKKYINIDKELNKFLLKDYIRLSNLIFLNKLD